MVLNLPRGRAIDLGKVTFLTFLAFFQIFPISSKTTRLIFLPIFSETIDFLKNYPSRFGIKGLIDSPAGRKLPAQATGP